MMELLYLYQFLLHVYTGWRTAACNVMSGSFPLTVRQKPHPVLIARMFSI